MESQPQNPEFRINPNPKSPSALWIHACAMDMLGISKGREENTLMSRGM